ncbi:MAG TPA: tRNA-uridine aminocarboxypropyltransferase [Polyangia bacterium]|nr:tRNA-uridine aminocarboxypropyltransferase [Polyangia bacterium]
MIAQAVSPHRAVCERCRRPQSVCYCEHLVSLETRTRVVLLQHPRESHVPIGTARLAHLCLPGSELHVGVDFSDDSQVRAALEDDAGRPAYLLFPGPNAVDLSVAPPPGPITLVVVDGTWWQARKLLKRNARLRELPQIRFTPPALSNYRIRKEPADHCVATVEALSLVLGALEGAPERFAALLRPFEAMIDTQIRYATTVRGARRRHALHRARKSRKPTTASRLRDWAERVVCVHGEANAWPARAAGDHPPELIHWTAVRPTTGETFEAVIAPRRPLAPAIPGHIGIPADQLAAGESWSSFCARWAAFARPDDVVCSWGHYALNLAEAEGLALAPARLDLRPAVTTHLGERPRIIEDCAERMAVGPQAPLAAGRGGARLAALAVILKRITQA